MALSGKMCIRDRDGMPRRIDVQPGETVVLDMPDGKGGTAPMLMQIVTGTDVYKRQLLDSAGPMKELFTKSVKKVPALKGKSVLTLFYEPSTDVYKRQGHASRFSSGRGREWRGRRKCGYFDVVRCSCRCGEMAG